MRRLKLTIRDWWRGYTDADLRSVRDKLRQARQPGEIVMMSSREMKALVWALNDEPIALRVESDTPPSPSS